MFGQPNEERQTMPTDIKRCARTPSRRSPLPATAACLLAAAAIAFYEPHVASAAPQLIRYSTGGGIGPNEIETVVFLDWMKQNVLKRHGKDYTLQMSFARGTPEAASLLAAGQVDIATLSYPIFATSLLKDAVPGGITAIADIYQAARPGFHSNSYWCREDSGIQKITDLKGKTIAVNAFGASTDLVLRVALKKAGLDPKRDVRVVEVGFPAMAAAVREKRVDCGILVLPFSAVEVPKGGLRAVFDETAAFGPYSVIFQTVSNNFLKAKPDAVKAYLADYVEGLHWLYDPANREKAIELTAELTKSPRAVLETYFLTSKDYYRDRNGCVSAALLQQTVDALVEHELLPARVDMSKHVDASYLPLPCSR
jgi:sulfonate transport system substrate-binding protein